MGEIAAQSGVDTVRIQQQTNKIGNMQKGKLHMKPGQVDEVAQEYEAVFLSQMLQHMFAGVETNELFGGGEAEDVYRSMMIDEYGKLIAKTGGIGVADHVKREMLKLQEVE